MSLAKLEIRIARLEKVAGLDDVEKLAKAVDSLAVKWMGGKIDPAHREVVEKLLDTSNELLTAIRNARTKFRELSTYIRKAEQLKHAPADKSRILAIGDLMSQASKVKLAALEQRMALLERAVREPVLKRTR